MLFFSLLSLSLSVVINDTAGLVDRQKKRTVGFVLGAKSRLVSVLVDGIRCRYMKTKLTCYLVVVFIVADV